MGFLPVINEYFPRKDLDKKSGSSVNFDPRILTAQKILEELALLIQDLGLGKISTAGHSVSVQGDLNTYETYVADPDSSYPSDIKWETEIQKNAQSQRQSHKLTLYKGKIPEWTISISNKSSDSSTPAYSTVTEEPGLALLTTIVSDIQIARMNIARQKSSSSSA